MKNKKILFIAAFLIILGTILYFVKLSQVSEPADLPISYYMVYSPLSAEDTPPADSLPIEGCDIEYLVKVPSINNTVGTLEQALNELFALPVDYDQTDLTNPLGLSDATATVTETESSITVDISGMVISAGSCDDPRVRSQLEQTIQMYAIDKTVTIRLNGSNTNWRCWNDMSGECQ